MLQIIVISRLDAHARRASISRQLKQCNLKFQFLDAIDGYDGRASILSGVDERRFLIETGRSVTLSEIGCYASHVAAWRICAAGNAPILVLEDAAELSDDFADAVALCTQLIDQCGYIRLQAGVQGRSRSILEIDEKFSLCCYSKVPPSAAGYVISPEVARRFAAAAAVMTAPIDAFVKKFWIHRQPMYGLTPYVVSESPLRAGSTLSSRQNVPLSMQQQLGRLALNLHGFVCRLILSRIHAIKLLRRSARPAMPAASGALRIETDSTPGESFQSEK